MNTIQNVTLKRGFTVRKIIELITMNEKFKSEIHFVKNHQTCNGKSLLGLMSLLLVTKVGEEYDIVVNGEDAKEVLNHINLFLNTLDSENTLSIWEEEGVEKLQQEVRTSLAFSSATIRPVVNSYLKTNK